MAGTARKAAVRLLGEVLDGRQLLSQTDGMLSGLAPADRARAQRLCAQTLRHLEQADRVLKPLLRKAPPPEVLNVLRLSVVELAMGEAAHGVVNEAVGMVRADRHHAALSGLVNAVLRKVAALPAPFAKLPPQRLPYWLRKPLVDTYGREVVSAIEAVQAQPAPIDLTSRADRAVPEGADLLPSGSLRLPAGTQVSAVEGYAEGNWWVQDAAAAMAVALLDPRPGERVLDLCAAPGGKTLQLAAAGASVLSLDVNERRLERLHENLARTGLTAEIVVADALHWSPTEAFDAILLDAPCSATGTIRRHPDLPFVKDGTELAELTALQAALLDRALGWLKPGGRLIYCTCSLLPDEGEAQLAAALARHPGLRVERPSMNWVEPGWITEDGGLRLRPDHWAGRGGMDGFFMARLSR